MIILKLSIFFILPTLTVIAYFYTPSREGKLLFTVFMLFAIAERVLEGLYTSNEKKNNKIAGDWTLGVSIMSYIILVIFCVFEFYYLSYKGWSVVITTIGLVVYISALVLRFWAIKTLGGQWFIHIIGDYRNENNLHMVKNGPYKYLKHPVYVGTILEQVAIPLVVNAYFTFFIFGVFSVIFNVIKMKIEEEQIKKDLEAIK